mmetsp:Transcript_119344/g.337616  ORF Transcript_119344/g.337616 Transcript_119344/m.337616 type:complete len:132 (+) Transcript_119344:70-465(+)|eukprot:CAMPEP_0117506050 /NCGR_PEP_ID=MMETSP0784-20121206/25702_1 /TAXON_ID=39447 /ORGANISM="" /LENGTH=131 /DNA_ID=CAMNT_0005301499 /DNA_START=69 /DNA_END=464 /DNA_ORIENTATION=+
MAKLANAFAALAFEESDSEEDVHDEAAPECEEQTTEEPEEVADVQPAAPTNFQEQVGKKGKAAKQQATPDVVQAAACATSEPVAVETSPAAPVAVRAQPAKKKVVPQGPHMTKNKFAVLDSDSESSEEEGV